MVDKILNRDFYVQTSIVIPIFKDRYGKDNLVFEVRVEQLRQGNEICFPGALFDPEMDNNFEEAAIRETSEELGINRNKISVSKHLDCVVTHYGTIIESFIGIIDITDLNELDYNKTEVSKVFPLPLSFFRENNPEEYETLSRM